MGTKAQKKKAAQKAKREAKMAALKAKKEAAKEKKRLAKEQRLARKELTKAKKLVRPALSKVKKTNQLQKKAIAFFNKKDKIASATVKVAEAAEQKKLFAISAHDDAKTQYHDSLTAVEEAKKKIVPLRKTMRGGTSTRGMKVMKTMEAGKAMRA